MTGAAAGGNDGGALADLRVLDLTGPIGVYCGKLLADLGADVVKIEPPAGDPMRQRGPLYPPAGDATAASPAGERSLYWWHFNTSKRGITLDIETEQGQALFRRLAGAADIVLESFTPGYLDALGLGWQALHALNPNLILTSITPFGQDGPYARYKGPDLVGQAMGGVMDQVGFADRAPYVIGGEMGFWTAATLAADATMLALASRDSGGDGQHVDVSMQQAVALGMGNAMPMYDLLGQVVSRGGLGLGGGPPLRSTYPCKDGWVYFLPAVPGTSVSATAALLAEHGMGEEFDPAWHDFRVLRANPDEAARFESLMLRFFARFTRRQLLELAFERADQVFVVPVDSAGDVLTSPQIEARGFLQPVEHPELQTTITYPGAPYRMPESPWRIARRAPLLGEHNDQIYAELGLTGAERRRLKDDGVI